MLGISYEVEKEYLEQFTQAVKDYSENVNKNMGYLTKSSLEEGFQTMIRLNPYDRYCTQRRDRLYWYFEFY